jgi:hypothetical protein
MPSRRSVTPPCCENHRGLWREVRVLRQEEWLGDVNGVV